MKKFVNSKIYGAVFLLILVFSVGILAFRFFSGYTWIDAIYMTVISITTVGFQEVRPLGPFEKMFTSLLILSSIFIVGYALSVITEYMLSKNNIGNLKQKRVQKKVDLLRNHVIVCGYGRNGKQAVEKLLDYKKDFVVIEIDEQIVERFSETDMLFIPGNADEDEVLLQAGITVSYTHLTLPTKRIV